MLFRAVFTHDNQDPSRVKFVADGNGGASEFATQFKDDGVFYGLRKSQYNLLRHWPCMLAVNLRANIVSVC